MNKTNIRHAINIMERNVDRPFDMHFWQMLGGKPAVGTEEHLHVCCYPASFGGYVAVSPEFQCDGGEVSFNGSPLLESYSGPKAIAKWLGINTRTANDLCCDAIYCGANWRSFYNVDLIADVTCEMVIEKLKYMLDNAEEFGSFEQEI